MDIIFLNEFRAETIIGVYPWEREVPQTIQLDLEIGLPHSRAGTSDDVADTIDYGKVVERIQQVLAPALHIDGALLGDKRHGSIHVI
jgi:dihydroneopterin aldolase